ncbi:MAG TPA: galactose oxidase early set domain-containing protein, partial [Miltoncostaeaceae bacterium]|nr:galactose oxidase early set domain-containing protein [Miltoncostaeaceae bacterium]
VVPSASRRTQIYPHLFTLEGDRVLLAGPNRGDTAVLDTGTWRWTDIPDIPVERLWGAATLAAFDADEGPRRLRLTGGADTAVTGRADGRTYEIDVTNPRAGWREGPTMAQGRAHLNVVGLPDGSHLAVGGGSGLVNGDLRGGPVFTAELLREGAAAWEEVPGQTVRRTYHSTAWLLPDGRVVSAGDDRDAVVRDLETYSPPYLFAGPRPQVLHAPAAVEYAATFRIATPDAARVGTVVMVTPGSTTHATDMTQRTGRLRILARDADGLVVRAPRAPGGLMPGYQMLMLVDDAGVPSVGRWVRLALPGTPPPGDGDGPARPDAPAPPSAAPLPRPSAARPPGVISPAAPPSGEVASAPGATAAPRLRAVGLQRRGTTTRVLLRSTHAGTVTVTAGRGPRAVAVCRVRVRPMRVATCRLGTRARPLTAVLRARGGTVRLSLPAAAP